MLKFESVCGECSEVSLGSCCFPLDHVHSKVQECGTCFPCLMLVFSWDWSEYQEKSVVFWPDGTER